jgi:hypothetical protein
MDVWILKVGWLLMIINKYIYIRMEMVIFGEVFKVKIIRKIDLINLNIFKFLEFPICWNIVLIVL